MDTAEILRHILIVLVAAKVAAEVAERLGIPAVVGEIVAGILVGPSVLNAIGQGDEVLRTLGEIGVILLLLDVGLEMDLRELGKVGRTSLQVATVGVVAPMVLGLGAMSAMGEDFNTALFVGAALTATSVGITARVFGDLRALATHEARIVLGAAVADDVMGLVVLTVVVRLVTDGSVSALSVAEIVSVAVLFLALGAILGLRLAPALFGAIDRVSRSAGTLVALALAFTLAFAELADMAKLAPIIGAFLAGLALNKAEQGDRVRRELTPIGHILIPVFFLQIGVDVDVAAFGRAEVLRDRRHPPRRRRRREAPLAAGRHRLAGRQAAHRPRDAAPGRGRPDLRDDRPPDRRARRRPLRRAAPGRAGHDAGHAPLLKVRYQRLRADSRPPSVPLTRRRPTVAGSASTATRSTCGRGRPTGSSCRSPSTRPCRWRGDGHPTTCSTGSPTPTRATSRFTRALTSKLLDVIERGNARSWRFLETSGVLDAALPELAAALRRRAGDGISLDGSYAHRLQIPERLRMLDGDDPLALEVRTLEHVDRLLLAAFLIESLDEEPDPQRLASAALFRLDIDPADRDAVLEHVPDRNLLWSAVHQPGALSEERVLELAAHLDTPERARALYLLSALRSDGRERWEMQRLRALYGSCRRRCRTTRSPAARPDRSPSAAGPTPPRWSATSPVRSSGSRRRPAPTCCARRPPPWPTTHACSTLRPPARRV